MPNFKIPTTQWLKEKVKPDKQRYEKLHRKLKIEKHMN